MAETPLSLQIVNVVVARLQAIPEVSPDFHTHPTAVLHGQPSADEGSLVFGVYSNEETAAEDTHPRIRTRLTVHIEAQVPLEDKADEAGSLPELVIADIQRAVEIEADQSLGGLAPGRLRYEGRSIQYPMAGSLLAMVKVKYSVTSIRRYGEPGKRA